MRTAVNLGLLISIVALSAHCSPGQEGDGPGTPVDVPTTTSALPNVPSLATSTNTGAAPSSPPSASMPSPEPQDPAAPTAPATSDSSTSAGVSSAAPDSSTSGDVSVTSTQSNEGSSTDAGSETEAGTDSGTTDETSGTTQPAPPVGPIQQPADACAPRAGYRNLFVELLGKTEAEVDAKVEAAYQQLFFGGSDETVYYETGADEAYILDVNNNDVRSEGMSYGMTIAVQMDEKEVFDRLWKWSRTRMYVSSGQLAGYFNWQMSPNGQVIGGPSAPDGEEYFVTALILATKKWGDGEGIFAYSTEARNLLSALASKGNFNREAHLVTFGPTCCYGYTDPSYVLPAFYELWACFDPQSQFWKNAVSAGRTHLQRAPHSQTGLAPYLANFDGSPHPSGPEFNTDSWRVVGNIMMDYHLYRQDDWHENFADRYADFFISQQGKQPVPAEFTLNGNPTVSYEEPAKGLVAQNALLAFAVAPEKGRPFLQALWDSEIPTGQYRYYDGMLYMLALLHASGRFKVD